ncbi:DUF488 family protein [Pseudomonas mohnii]
MGHSTRPIDEFLGLLNEYEIETVIDVRRFPGSREGPQYGQTLPLEYITVTPPTTL